MPGGFAALLVLAASLGQQIQTIQKSVLVKPGQPNTYLGDAATTPLACRLTDGASFYSASASNGLTDVQLRASAVPVSGTFWQATQPISAASLPLPSGAAQEHATAGSPNSCRLSDGSSFYATLSSGQLPSALDGSGYLKIHEQGTAVIGDGGGSITVDASSWPLPTGAATETSLAKLTLGQGSTTSGQTGPMCQAAVTTSAPSYSTGQTSPLSLTTTGALRVDGSASTQPISGSVGLSAGTAYVGKVRQTDGTLDLTLLNAAPGSDTGQVSLPVRVISSLAAAGAGGTQYAEDTASADAEQLMMCGVIRKDTRATTVSTDGDRAELQVNANGDLRVDGSAVAQPVTDNGGSLTIDSAQLPAALDGSGYLKVHEQGTAAISAASLPLPSGAATETSLAKLPVTQGSTTSGQSGPLAQGAVTTAAPTYTNAQTSPLSLTPGGLLRVDGSGVTQPVSGTFWQATQPVSGTVAVSTGFLLDTTFTARINTLGQKTMANSTPVVLSSDQSAIPVTDNGGSLTIDSAQLPGALAANGGLKIEGVASGVAVPVSGPLTDTQLRATDVPVALTSADQVTVANASLAVTGPVTDAQLRAIAVPVSGTFYQTTQPVSGTVTDSGLDASGTARTLATTQNGVIYVLQLNQPLNPFLQRCNAVRRSNCQP